MHYNIPTFGISIIGQWLYLKKLLSNFLLWSSQHSKEFITIHNDFRVRVPNLTETVSFKSKKRN